MDLLHIDANSCIIPAFRDTFSRPVRRIRFLGLFDTVNSVPHFESRWMQRKKFPYTANSSALVIRHAVSIDERRAKFRSDLISEVKKNKSHEAPPRPARSDSGNHLIPAAVDQQPDAQKQAGFSGRYRRTSKAGLSQHGRRPSELLGGLRERRSMSPIPSVSPGRGNQDGPSAPGSTYSVAGALNTIAEADDDDDDADEALPQDVQELWFPGCHAVSAQPPTCIFCLSLC